MPLQVDAADCAPRSAQLQQSLMCLRGRGQIAPTSRTRPTMPASDLPTDTADSDGRPKLLTFAPAGSAASFPELIEIVRLLARQAAREYHESQRNGAPGAAAEARPCREPRCTPATPQTASGMRPSRTSCGSARCTPSARAGRLRTATATSDLGRLAPASRRPGADPGRRPGPLQHRAGRDQGLAEPRPEGHRRLLQAPDLRGRTDRHPAGGDVSYLHVGLKRTMNALYSRTLPTRPAAASVGAWRRARPAAVSASATTWCGASSTTKPPAAPPER